MQKITVELTGTEQRRLRILIQRTHDAGLRTRMLLILHLSRRRPVMSVADSLHVARSTVYRVVERFEEEGLERTYPTARVIHVIVDNYSIHTSRQTALALAALPRIRLHRLPPYSREFNPIERVWLDLHAEVTRNHRHATIATLMADVHGYLRRRNQRSRAQILRAVA